MQIIISHEDKQFNIYLISDLETNIIYICSSDTLNTKTYKLTDVPYLNGLINFNKNIMDIKDHFGNIYQILTNTQHFTINDIITKDYLGMEINSTDIHQLLKQKITFENFIDLLNCIDDPDIEMYIHQKMANINDSEDIWFNTNKYGTYTKIIIKVGTKIFKYIIDEKGMYPVGYWTYATDRITIISNICVFKMDSGEIFDLDNNKLADFMETKSVIINSSVSCNKKYIYIYTSGSNFFCKNDERVRLLAKATNLAARRDLNIINIKMIGSCIL